VSKLKTAKAIPAKAEIFKYFQGHHLSLEIYERDSLTEADIEHRLRAAGGAHQPSDMQFPGGGHEVKTVTDIPVTIAATSSSPSIDTPSSEPSAPAPKTSPPAPAPSKFSAPAPVAAPAGNPKAAAKLARASEEANAASLAVGKAAARLEEIMKEAEDGKVSVDTLKALVATELATAALKIAAASATVQEAK